MTKTVRVSEETHQRLTTIVKITDRFSMGNGLTIREVTDKLVAFAYWGIVGGEESIDDVYGGECPDDGPADQSTVAERVGRLERIEAEEQPEISTQDDE